METPTVSMSKPLLTRTPICSALQPNRVGLLRTQFLSTTHTLRLHNNSNTKCNTTTNNRNSRKYKLRVVEASFDSQFVVVAAAAVVAVSAISVVYFSFANKKKIDVKEVQGRLSLPLSEQLRYMTSWILTESHPGRVRKEESKAESKDGHNEASERSGAGDIVSEFKLIENEKISGGAFHNEVASETAASSVHAETPFVSSEHSGHEISPLDLENHEVYAAVHEPHISVATDFSFPQIQTHSSTTHSVADHISEETDESVTFKIQPLEESAISSSGVILRNFVGKELYSIDESSMERLDSREPLTSCATLQKKSSYSSTVKNVLMEGSAVTAANLILPTVRDTQKFEGKIHLGYYYNQGIFCQQQDPRNRKESRKKGKHIFHPEKTQKLSLITNAKGKGIDGTYNPSWHLRVYNQLLREGRVKDCIALLEDLEKNGLLDMDKIYHVRFFDACKSQKSVKEAFRFTRLISNPTLSTFNMLMSVCACSQDSEGAFQVLQYVRDVGLNVDCKLFTTLISTCAKSGKVDTMFKVFHEMVNAGVEPNVHTYGALIDGCARAGQVAKAFGAYGILRSKNVKPDRVVFNALITACGQSKAVDRAFDVLAEMRAELQPIDPDHVTVGALMKACAGVGQVDRAREVYKMIQKYDIRGSAELYTIAINSCSHHGDWDFACSVYDDMIKKGVAPDEMFISALVDVAGHAGKVDAAFEILQAARSKGMRVGIISYSSLMGACSNAKDWQKALELYEGIKGLNLKPTVPMMNALITVLCEADKLQNAIKYLFEMKSTGLTPNTVTYSILLAASEKNDDLDAGLMLISEAKKDGAGPNLVMCRCLVAMCLRRFQKASAFGEPVLSFSSGQGHLNSKWTSLALMVYRETITAGAKPTMDELSLVLGCLRLPHDMSVRNRLIEYLGVNNDTSKAGSLCSRIDGFGEYDPRAFSLLEEAASLGVIPFASIKESPIVVDLRNFQVHTAEVYLLTVLKALKHRLAAGVIKLPNVTIFLPIEKSQIQTLEGDKPINIAGRISQSVASLLRRVGLFYQGNESFGKIRLKGVTIKMWLQPNQDSPFGARTTDLNSSFRRLGSGISRQQRKIRSGHLSLQ